MEKMDLPTRLCVIQGLQSESGKMLNGRVAEVMHWDARSSRLCVRLDAADLKPAWKRMKSENVDMRTVENLQTRGEFSNVKPIGWYEQDAPVAELAELSLMIETRLSLCDWPEHWYPLLRRMSRCASSFLFLLRSTSIKNSTLLMKCEHLVSVLKSYSTVLMKCEHVVSVLKSYSNPLVRKSIAKTINKFELLSESIRLALVLNEVLYPSPRHGSLFGSVVKTKEEKDALECDMPVFQDVDHGDEEAARRDPGLLQEQADHDWADNVNERIRSEAQHGNDDAESIYIYPYSRTPPEFSRVLLEGPELHHVRDRLSQHGFDCVLEPSGAKIFVKPHQYPIAVEALARNNIVLRPSHVIVTESFIPELEAGISTIPSRKNVRAKSSGVLTLPCQNDQYSNSADVTRDAHSCNSVSNRGLEHSKAPFSLYLAVDQDWEDLLAVERTFLCKARLLRAPDSVSQSTTEAHGGLNPTRLMEC